MFCVDVQNSEEMNSISEAVIHFLATRMCSVKKMLRKI